MKVIITGGAGFIGSHLAERLIKEQKIKSIIIIDHFQDGSIKNLRSFSKNKKIKIIKKNICNIRKNESVFKNAECVFHLAAIADIVPSIEKPFEYCNNNFIGTLRILEAMRHHKIKKIIFAASASCYGIPKKYPTNEKEKILTKYPYAFSKFISELAIIHWAEVYKINFISLRLFNVYGLRSRTTGAYGAVMGIFLKQKLSNKPLTLVGDGNQKRDFVNVTDVAEAFVKAFKSKIKNEIFNIGASKPIKIIELIKMLNCKFIKIKKRPGEPDITFANIYKARKYLKWQPRMSFEDGMNELIQNINYWDKAPLWNKKSINKSTKTWFKYLR